MIVQQKKLNQANMSKMAKGESYKLEDTVQGPQPHEDDEDDYE